MLEKREDGWIDPKTCHQVASCARGVTQFVFCDRSSSEETYLAVLDWAGRGAELGTCLELVCIYGAKVMQTLNLYVANVVVLDPAIGSRKSFGDPPCVIIWIVVV